MPRYAIRSLNGIGLVARKYGTNAKDLDEAHAHARHILRSTIDGAISGGWTGWFVDVIEDCGRSRLSVPVCLGLDAQRRSAT